MQSFLKTGLFLFLGGLNAIAEVQLVKSTQSTHCKKERRSAHIAMTIQSRAIAAQLVGSGQTANWRLEAKINFACSGKIFTFLQFCSEDFFGQYSEAREGWGKLRPNMHFHTWAGEQKGNKHLVGKVLRRAPPPRIGHPCYGL